jgi:LacI family transcriptional regulator
MAVRMKDIADLLGLSQTTVSHVLRGRDGEFRIGAETARRVREAAERLRYRPSALALGFKHQRAYALGLAVGDLANPFWAGVAMGAQAEAEQRGYSLVVSHTGEAIDKERLVVEMLRDRRVDGLVLSPVRLRAQHLAALRREGLPFVLVDRYIDGLEVPSVVTDSFAGLELAVGHLVSKGHRRIAYLGGPQTISTFRDRSRAFHEALERRGLTPGPSAVAPSDPEAARRAAARILKKGGEATAVIAANFWLTVGTLRAAPENMTVVGFDELFLADLLRRPVTTVAQPVEDLGRHSVRLLLEEIAKPGGARHLVLPPRLVVREEVDRETSSVGGRTHSPQLLELPAQQQSRRGRQR